MHKDILLALTQTICDTLSMEGLFMILWKVVVEVELFLTSYKNPKSLNCRKLPNARFVDINIIRQTNYSTVNSWGFYMLW